MIQKTIIDIPSQAVTFFHEMHDKLTVTHDQSLRFGTTGTIPIKATSGPFAELLNQMNAAIGRLVTKPWQYKGLWSNRIKKGGFHVQHTHPDGWMSGIVYLDVPDNTSGHLKFEEGKLIPMTGDVVIFPSTTPHEVTEYQSDKPRLTVVFDLVPA